MPDARRCIIAIPNWKARPLRFLKKSILIFFDLGSTYVLSVEYYVQYVSHIAKLIVFIINLIAFYDKCCNLIAFATARE